jgi:hypothetical protein
MKLTHHLAAAAVAMTSLSIGSSASAAVLTFDGAICGGATSCSNGETIDQSYGDSALIDVMYDRNQSTAVLNNFLYWADAYSGLTNIGYADSGAIGSIFLRPLLGSLVTLNSFNLGAWPNFDRPSQVTILDGLGTTLFSSGPITVLGATPSLFSGSYASLNGIEIRFGPDAFNVGIDNIDFTVANGPAAVPEPASWALMIAGFGLVGSAMRRRKPSVSMRFA